MGEPGGAAKGTKDERDQVAAPTGKGSASAMLVRRHLRFGWWALLVFLTLGLVLEGLHGFKLGWYLDVANETRRLMLTLGHAHGTLIALINLAFASTCAQREADRLASWRLASWWLIGAGVALPAGFLLGGLVTYGGDPGPGVVLVAIGGLMLLAAVLSVALSLSSSADTSAEEARQRG